MLELNVQPTKKKNVKIIISTIDVLKKKSMHESCLVFNKEQEASTFGCTPNIPWTQRFVTSQQLGLFFSVYRFL